MLQRPMSIVSVTFLLGVVGPIAAIWWINTRGSGGNMLVGMDPFVTALGLLSAVVGYGVWRVKSWGYYAYLCLSGFAVIMLFYEFALAPNLEDFLVLFGVTTFIIGSCILVQKHVNAPYFNPNFTWGKRDPRYRVNVDVKFEVNKMPIIGGLFDISRSGCFAELSSDLKIGDLVELRIQILGYDFNFNARVVRKGTHPVGYGFMFESLGRREKREIDNVIAFLKESHQNADMSPGRQSRRAI